MKKIIMAVIILSLSSALIYSQQNKGPVYVNGLGVGASICEFAVDGSRKNMIEKIEPYIQNGRVYFFCGALTISSGNLRPGFEFNLDLEKEAIQKPRIKGIYQGSQKDAFNTKDGVIVAGYAERGTIIVTNAFLESKKAESWAKNKKLAY